MKVDYAFFYTLSSFKLHLHLTLHCGTRLLAGNGERKEKMNI
jgi:hypothetical protein